MRQIKIKQYHIQKRSQLFKNIILLKKGASGKNVIREQRQTQKNWSRLTGLAGSDAAKKETFEDSGDLMVFFFLLSDTTAEVEEEEEEEEDDEKEDGVAKDEVGMSFLRLT